MGYGLFLLKTLPKMIKIRIKEKYRPLEEWKNDAFFWGIAFSLIFVSVIGFFASPAKAYVRNVGEIQNYVDTGDVSAHTTFYLNVSEPCHLFAHFVAFENPPAGEIHPKIFLTDDAGATSTPPMKDISDTDNDVDGYRYRIRTSYISDAGRYGVKIYGRGNMRFNIFCLAELDDYNTWTFWDRGGGWGTEHFNRTLTSASSSLGVDNRGTFVEFFGAPINAVSLFTAYDASNYIISSAASTTSGYPINIGSIIRPVSGDGTFQVGIADPPASTNAYGYHYSIYVPFIGSSTPPEEPTPSATSTLESHFYNVGDYVVPRSINCYQDLDYCDMVFGYNMDVFSRSLASTSPDLSSYPRFTWFWPNSLGTDIVSSTIRYFLDIGQEPLTVNFNFLIPTSTTDYVLQIDDPNNSSGVELTDFVIRVNLLGTSTESDLFSTCFGKCTSGIAGDIFCAFKRFTCWAFLPSENSKLYISQSAEKIKASFPFSIPFGVLDAVRNGLQPASDDMSVGFKIPLPIATTTGHKWAMTTVLDASSTSNLIGKDNAALFRITLVWLAWIAAAFCLFFLIIKPHK